MCKNGHIFKKEFTYDDGKVKVCKICGFRKCVEKNEDFGLDYCRSYVFGRPDLRDRYEWEDLKVEDLIASYE